MYISTIMALWWFHGLNKSAHLRSLKVHLEYFFAIPLYIMINDTDLWDFKCPKYTKKNKIDC